MQTYTVTEAKAKFAEAVAKAAAGEEISLTRLGKEVARIVPPKPKDKGLIGMCEGEPYYIADDFDELPDEIARAFGMID